MGITGKLIKKNLPDVKKICVITDKKIPSKLFKKLINSIKNYDLNIYKLIANEKNKNINIANKIIENLLKDNFNRSDCLISLFEDGLSILLVLIHTYCQPYALLKFYFDHFFQSEAPHLNY